MLADATIGSKVALLNGKKIIGKATIKDQTNCYWHLSNDQRVRKELGYYWESHNKSKQVFVKVWSEEIELLYQAHLETERAALIRSAQKAKLHNYVEYMRTSYFGQLSTDQIAKILAVCQDQIGDLKSPRIR